MVVRSPAYKLPAHISVERLGLHITDATFSYIKRVTLKVFDFWITLSSFGRDEATRTPDPYVPNVVRYQLRYIPIPALSSTFPKEKKLPFGVTASSSYKKPLTGNNFRYESLFM